MHTTPRLNKHQKETLARAIYLLNIAAYTDFVDTFAIVKYDGVDCDGYCFQDDSRNAVNDLLLAFGPVKLPKDTPRDPRNKD